MSELKQIDFEVTIPGIGVSVVSAVNEEAAANGSFYFRTHERAIPPAKEKLVTSQNWKEIRTDEIVTLHDGSTRTKITAILDNQ